MVINQMIQLNLIHHHHLSQLNEGKILTMLRVLIGKIMRFLVSLNLSPKKGMSKAHKMSSKTALI